MKRSVRIHYAAMARRGWRQRFLLLFALSGCAPAPLPPADDPSSTPPMPSAAPPCTEAPPPPEPPDPSKPPPPTSGTPCQNAAAHALNYYCPLTDPRDGKWVDVCELAAQHARDLYSCVLGARSCERIRACENE